MGWKGALRSVQAAARQAERESRRRQRELERQQQQYERMLEHQQAEYEVAVYENHVERMVAVHKECSDPVDWKGMAAEPRPPEPVLSNDREREARERFENYQPNFIDRLFKREDTKRADLRGRMYEAKKEDEARNRELEAQHHREVADWDERRQIAERVLGGDREACLEAIKEIASFSEISELGSSLSFNWREGDRVPLEIELDIHSETAIPKESKSLLKSGKLSVKQTPKGVFYSLYQDYVCGCVLRVARETFALLPIDAVIVTASDEILNTQTGHLEQQPILSMAIPKATLERLNFDNLDPSDSLANFVHRMSFKKTKGFEPVERIRPEDVPALLASS